MCVLKVHIWYKMSCLLGVNLTCSLFLSVQVFGGEERQSYRGFQHSLQRWWRCHYWQSLHAGAEADHKYVLLHKHMWQRGLSNMGRHTWDMYLLICIFSKNVHTNVTGIHYTEAPCCNSHTPQLLSSPWMLFVSVQLTETPPLSLDKKENQNIVFWNKCWVVLNCFVKSTHWNPH